jgi:hypothetical protein
MDLSRRGFERPGTGDKRCWEGAPNHSGDATKARSCASKGTGRGSDVPGSGDIGTREPLQRWWEALLGSWPSERMADVRRPEYLGDPTKHLGRVSQGVGRVSRVAGRVIHPVSSAVPSAELAVPRTFIGSPRVFQRAPDHGCGVSQHLGRRSRPPMWGLPGCDEQLPGDGSRRRVSTQALHHARCRRCPPL